MLVNSDDITWITVKGNHIPIKKGQDKEQAIKEFFKSKQIKEPYNGITEKIVKKSIYVFTSNMCISKKNAYRYPKTIANVPKGQPMNFTQADSGRVNPYYNKKNYAYSHNCQCCSSL